MTKEWGEGRQEDTQAPCLPTQCSGESIPDLKWGEGQKRHPSRAGLEGKEVGSLHWGDREGVQAGFGQASMHLPLCIQLCSSGSLTMFQTPSQEPLLSSMHPCWVPSKRTIWRE